MALNKIKTNSITDDAISEEHLDNTAITGHSELSAASASDDVLLVFDTSAGAIKKIQRSNIAPDAPTFTSVTPTNANSGDGTGNHTFVITGTKFDSGATAVFINTSGTTINPTSSTRNSATQITAVIAKSSMPDSGEPYDVKILNGNGLNVVAENQININASPVFTTAAGTLGTVAGGSAISTIDVVAADPESAGNVSFEFQSGSLPAGLSSATVNENGVSKFRITGTPTNPSGNTTTNFVLRAVDAASNVTSRAFSITVNRSFTTTSFTSSGTFAVPSGVTALPFVLVVAGGGGGGSGNGTSGIGGGGGGAGGLVFMPCHPVTAGGTITVTVGNGGSGFPSQPSPGTPPSGGSAGQDSTFGSPGDPGLNPGGLVLTAKGGGTGGSRFAGTPSSGVHQGNSGGSGGGGSAGYPGVGAAGTATQSTQPGNSGAYGFGNNGGTGGPGNCNQSNTSGGGGGAGAAGINGNPGGPPCGTGGQGGTGKAYTIADGTSSVFYAGGGGGGRAAGNPNSSVATSGGQGGGGGGSTAGPTAPSPSGDAGTANRGGGGGGGGGTDGNSIPHQNGADGGKGIVIVRF